MRLFVAGAALAALCALSCAPASAQAQGQSSARAPVFAPGFRAAFDAAKQTCHELAVPYKGGMLEGKVPIDDEDISPAMMANESYPNSPESVVLRGLMGAFEKCENAQLAFLQTFAAWDVANARYVLDNEKPVYLSLMARRITYGMANRDIDTIQRTVSARRRATWPKEMLAASAVAAQERQRSAASQAASSASVASVAPPNRSATSQAATRQNATNQNAANQTAAIPDAAYQVAASQAMIASCDGLYAPIRNGRVLSGKISLSRDEPTTPAMMADGSRPSAAQAQALKDFAEAANQCQRFTHEYARMYNPGMLMIGDRQHEEREATLGDLAAGKLSFGEANRKFHQMESEWAEAVAANKARRDGAATVAAAPSAATSATAGQSMFQIMQPGTGP